MQPGYLLRNRYRIEQRLSAGAFGETYIAVDENPDYPIKRRVVVKHLKPQDNDPRTLKVARELFEKEAKTLAKLGETTDRIPTLYAYFEEKAKVGGEEKSEFYLVQELIEGQTLSKELGNRKLDEIETLKIIQNILIGLEKVHNSNNIHRDLKPDNIIRRNSNDKLVLIDFGAVKAVRQGTNPQISQTIGIGTPGYMPGEQWRGSPQFASDIYAVGAIALKCLTGIEPSELQDKDSGEFKWRHLCQVSDRVANVLYKMVAILHPDRYANATIAKQEIESLISPSIPTQVPPPIPIPTPVISTVPTKPAVLYPPPQPVKSPVNQGVKPLLPKPIKLPTTQQAKSPLRGIDRRKFFKWLGFGWFGLASTSVLALKHVVDNLPSLPTANLLSQAGIPPKLTKIQFSSVKLDNKGKIVDKPAGSANIFTEDLGNGFGLTMVEILAGKFLMGSPESEEDRSPGESPQHKVTVPRLYIGQTLVTQAQWTAIMGNNPAHFRGNDKLPVDSVSWVDAVYFCQKLSQKMRRTYRLPSEAEWEYACRAGTASSFAFGETITPDVVNYDGNYPPSGMAKGKYREETTPVGSFPPNLFGLYDMHGNLWEWCLDEYSFDHYSYVGASTDGSPRGDVLSQDENKSRILRGGASYSHASHCRSASRYNYAASNHIDYYGYNFGFRVVCIPSSTS